MDSAAEKIQRLREDLRRMEDAYYSGRPAEEDEVYDLRLRTLVELENLHPELRTEDSPTSRVGFYREDNLTDDHEEPMLSLNNAFGREDLDGFFENCSRSSEDIEYVLEPKIDGASISLIYREGFLHRALSRGNGETGEDLTAKILHIPGTPIHIGDLPREITVRGEIYIRKSDFEAVRSEGGRVFANHRNYVAGCLRLKKSSELAKKRLRIRVYQILSPERYGFKRQSEVLERLGKWGFETQEEVFVSGDRERVWEHIVEFGKRKGEMDIPCDGMVIKVNNLEVREDIGFTSKFPKWAVAYKYPSTVRESRLLEIIPTVGRTGKITYSARVEPVEIDGSTVQYATLHNANYIMELDLRIGDHVGIYKSGEIVPRIVGYSPRKRPEGLTKWIPLESCPSCGSGLVTRENLSTQFCENEDCREKIHARLTHWVSKNAADIEGLSDKIIAKFTKLGILSGIDDIYAIKNHRDLILGEDLKIKERLFEKIVGAIEESKNRELRNLLFGLGINFIGEEVASEIARKYRSIDEIMGASAEDLERIDGVGNKAATAVVQWFSREKNRDLIGRLRALGLFSSAPVEREEMVESFLAGKRVAITGKLSRPRPEFSRMLEERYGAIVCRDISSRVNYLICGEESGSKLRLAREKNIEVLEEGVLLERLGEKF